MRSIDADQAPQQSRWDDGDGSDRLNVHADRRTDGRPAEAERCGVSLQRADNTTSHLHQLRDVQSLSAAHNLLQHLRQTDRFRLNLRYVKLWKNYHLAQFLRCIDIRSSRTNNSRTLWRS